MCFMFLSIPPQLIVNDHGIWQFVCLTTGGPLVVCTRNGANLFTDTAVCPIEAHGV